MKLSKFKLCLNLDLLFIFLFLFLTISCKDYTFDNLVDTKNTIAAPTGLTVSFSADTMATVTWQHNLAGDYIYVVDLSADGTNWQKFGEVSNAKTLTAKYNFQIAKNYTFRVSALSDQNKSSYLTAQAQITTLAAPSELTVSFPTDTKVTLTWKDNSTIETGFEIEMSTDGTNYAFAKNVGANTTTVDIDGTYLTTGNYSFRMRAKSKINYSLLSNTTQGKPGFNAPTNLLVTFPNDTKATLTWTDNSSYETGFELEVSSDGINYAIASTVTSNITSTEVGYNFLTTENYLFRVRAKSANNYSSYSNVTQGKPVVNAPTNLRVSFPNDTRATLTWIDNCNYESGFDIEMGTDGINYQVVKSVKANIQSADLEGIFLTSATYYFRVKAKTAYNYSISSNIAQVKLLGITAPSNLQVSFPTDLKATLSWTDNSNNETGFEVELSSDGINYAIAGSVGQNITSTIVGYNFLTTGNYTFRVRAKTDNNYSTYSTVIQGYPVVNSPSNLQISFPNITKATLTWIDNCNYETGFEIEISSDGINYAIANTVSQNITFTDVDYNYQFGVSYYFRVRTKTTINYSPYSNIASLGLKPLIPILNFPENKSIDQSLTTLLGWYSNSGVTSYKLQVATSNSFSGLSLLWDENVGSQTSKQLTGLNNAQTYYWRVAAINSFGISDWSNTYSFETIGFILRITSINGTVNKNPNQSSYARGINVQLTALPNPGYTFLSWSGDASGTSNPLTILLDREKNITANFTAIVSGACQGIPTVSYSGKTYNTVAIGSQCWLKENLDVGTRINGNQEQTNNNNIEKYCYNDTPLNCTTYGGLYQWAEAVQYKNGATNTSLTNPAFGGNVQGVCPSGWHIPSLSESNFLNSSVVVNGNGNVLKAQGEGSGSGVGNNSSGFTALLAGYRGYNGIFGYLSYSACFWSSTEYNGTYVNNIGLNFADNNVYMENNSKYYGFSVRCLKD